MKRERYLRRQFPWIRWDEPLVVQVPSVAEGLACRYCVALYGLQGADVAQLPQTEEEFEQHMAMFHG